MITKQEREFLRSKAQSVSPTVWVGKEGFSEDVFNTIDSELTAHELIKIALNPSMTKLSNDQLSEIATKSNSDVVTQIGKKIVLYRYSTKKNIKHVLDDKK